MASSLGPERLFEALTIMVRSAPWFSRAECIRCWERESPHRSSPGEAEFLRREPLEAAVRKAFSSTREDSLPTAP